MKRAILITILLCLCFKYGYSQYKLKDIPYSIDSINKSDKSGRQGIWFFYYTSDSTVIEMQHFRDDTLHGYFERFWANGKVSEKGFYKDGLYDSSYLAFWEDGSRRGEIFYRDGKLNGIAVMYDAAGNVTSRLRYIDDKVDSTYVEAYLNPNYVSDAQPIPKIDTVKTFFNADWNKNYKIYVNDTLSQEINFHRDVPLIEDFYQGGVIYKRITYFEKSPKKIEKIFYFNNGELSITEFYDKKGKVKIRENADKKPR